MTQYRILFNCPSMAGDELAYIAEAVQAGDCPVTEDISDRLLRLPFYNTLTPDDQVRGIDAPRKFAVGDRVGRSARTARGCPGRAVPENGSRAACHAHVGTVEHVGL